MLFIILLFLSLAPQTPPFPFSRTAEQQNVSHLQFCKCFTKYICTWNGANRYICTCTFLPLHLSLHPRT